MVVDDDEDVHRITRLVLRDYHFQGRGVRLIHAYSARQAWELMEKNPDTALILMDVIMETEHAGLDLVRKIRNSLGNNNVRILIRTGQPGLFNEYQIAMEYNINEYKEKSSLTADGLLASTTTLLREYSDLQNLHRQRGSLEVVIDQLNSMAQLFAESRIATMVLDSNLRITNINPAFSQLTGFNLEFISGKTPEFLRSNKNKEARLRAAWGNLLDSGSWEGELWCATKSHGDINIHLSATALDGDEKNFSSIALQFSDITEIKEKEKQLLQWATHDALTSLPNRNLLFSRLEEAITNAHRTETKFALLFIDLDYFKSINDTMGHKYGDKLLKQVGERLQQCIRKSDTVARVGGDEFTVIIGNFSDRKQIGITAAKISGALTRPFNLDGREASIAGSIGIALFPLDASEAEQLYYLADLAMYQAKHKGRNTYCFYSSETEPGTSGEESEKDNRRDGV